MGPCVTRTSQALLLHLTILLLRQEVPSAFRVSQERLANTSAEISNGNIAPSPQSETAAFISPHVPGAAEDIGILQPKLAEQATMVANVVNASTCQILGGATCRQGKTSLLPGDECLLRCPFLKRPGVYGQRIDRWKCICEGGSCVQAEIKCSTDVENIAVVTIVAFLLCVGIYGAIQRNQISKEEDFGETTEDEGAPTRKSHSNN